MGLFGVEGFREMGFRGSGLGLLRWGLGFGVPVEQGLGCTVQGC